MVWTITFGIMLRSLVYNKCCDLVLSHNYIFPFTEAYQSYAKSDGSFSVLPIRLFRVGWLLSDKNLNALKTSRYKTSPYLLEKNWSCQSQGLNPGPLACLSEMLTTTLSDLVMKLRNLGVYILHFSFYSTCNKNTFFYNGWHSISMVYKKLCYKILLLFYIDIFQFNFKHWYILLFAVQR